MTYPVTFRVSGEVVLKPIKTIPIGYSVWGNNTPVAITLEDIMVCNEAGQELNDFEIGETSSGSGITAGIPGTGKCRNLVEVKKLKLQASMAVDSPWQYTSQYALRTAGRPAANWGWKGNRTKTIAPGEGLIVRNQLAYPVKFKLKNPLTGQYED